jgi:hypothetical protein
VVTAITLVEVHVPTYVDVFTVSGALRLITFIRLGDGHRRTLDRGGNENGTAGGSLLWA